ncbi:MAG: MerR family transcriptional regulator [Burkholderiales bacterium]|nr:MerR family transcriptional regulator [Burkholderiales bacterium]
MDISEVARQSSAPASTLCFHEEKGLIASVSRRGLRRALDSRVLERLASNEPGFAAGISLDEIGRMRSAAHPRRRQLEKFCYS